MNTRISAAAALLLLGGCQPRMLAANPATSTDDPRTNQWTSAPIGGVPFCAGGDRGTACLLGKNCRVTERGCQVCQCLSP